ncbi:MAG: hypothetical protein RLZZ622_1100, partial [Planctomycetota bacterium]
MIAPGGCLDWQPPPVLGKQGLKAMFLGWTWPTFSKP